MKKQDYKFNLKLTLRRELTATKSKNDKEIHELEFRKDALGRHVKHLEEQIKVSGSDLVSVSENLRRLQAEARRAEAVLSERIQVLEAVA